MTKEEILKELKRKLSEDTKVYENAQTYDNWNITTQFYRGLVAGLKYAIDLIETPNNSNIKL